MTAAKALEISRAYVSQGCLCGHESAHIDLDTAFHGFFGLMEKLLARFGGQIAFAASLANFCGDSFENQGGSISLERRGHGAWLSSGADRSMPIGPSSCTEVAGVLISPSSIAAGVNDAGAVFVDILYLPFIDLLGFYKHRF